MRVSEQTHTHTHFPCRTYLCLCLWVTSDDNKKVLVVINVNQIMLRLHNERGNVDGHCLIVVPERFESIKEGERERVLLVFSRCHITLYCLVEVVGRLNIELCLFPFLSLSLPLSMCLLCHFSAWPGVIDRRLLPSETLSTDCVSPISLLSHHHARVARICSRAQWAAELCAGRCLCTECN